jgi:pimeloyl-ACP methyl ester carboxylesterase
VVTEIQTFRVTDVNNTGTFGEATLTSNPAKLFICGDSATIEMSATVSLGATTYIGWRIETESGCGKDLMPVDHANPNEGNPYAPCNKKQSALTVGDPAVRRFYVKAFCDGNANCVKDADEDYYYAADGSVIEVQVFIIKAEFVDARAFGPKMNTDGKAGLDTTDLRSSVAGSYLVDGALADGSSLCVLRVEPETLDFTGWTVELCNSGATSPGDAHVLGSVHTGDGTSLPTLPAGDRLIDGTSSCGSTSGNLTDGLAFYRPPNNFLIGADNEETKDFDVVLKKDGTEVCREPFVLVRSPVIDVHGIFRSDVIWGTHWTGNATYKANVVTLNYEPDASQGPPENYMKLAKLIDDTLKDYRDGYGSPAKEYAATRADVVGHSQGGQLARFYIADIPNALTFRDSGGVWPGVANIRSASASDGQWHYLRDDNFGAGSIRRLVTLGSPFRGSAWASLVAPVVEPDTAYGTTFFLTSGFGLGSAALKYRQWAWSDPTDYTLGCKALVCLMDNSPGSAVETLMDGATYPSGQKTVRWLPIVGIAQNDMGDAWGAAFGASFQIFYNLLDVALLGALPGSDDFDTIAELNPAVSDGIVPDFSQCDVSASDPLRGRSYEFTTHDRFLIPGTEAEFDRTSIADDVLQILSAEGNAADYYPLQ